MSGEDILSKKHISVESRGPLLPLALPRCPQTLHRAATLAPTWRQESWALVPSSPGQ